MYRITEVLLEKASQVVVMSKQSKDILINTYPSIDKNKIKFIPHGIHPVLFKLTSSTKPKIGMKNRIVLATFGLISRNKGIEYVLRALPSIVEKHPEVIYLILGSTHPVIRRQEGESYRVELLKLTEELGLKRNVRFYDQYFPLDDILKYLQATDIYLFTALDPMQSVSGTFSYALGTGAAVVSTTFNQAKEMITPEVGRLVPMKDSPAFTAAILELIHDQNRLEIMHHEAYLSTRSMLWSNVGEEFINLISSTSLPPINLNHLHNMVDDFGLVQFAKNSKPDYDSGYTLDDNARALIACRWISELYPEFRSEMKKYIAIFAKFVDFCVNKNGTYINYIAKDKRTATTQNDVENLNDSIGRIIWATSSPKLLEQAKYPRSIAMSILGLANHTGKNAISILADKLKLAFEENADEKWCWFEPELTYANGLLPAALLVAANTTGNNHYKEIAIKSLEFLIKTCFYGDVYVPIGQKRWFAKGKERSLFDAQPEDPCAMLIALEQAFYTTNDPRYARLARKCFSWYRGNNLTGNRMYDPMTGGCFDGLKQDGVNHNQGAESLISYLMARCIIDRINQKVIAHGS
jgi:hypothetical protein